MKQVWKCDFCHMTNTVQEVIAAHEEECSFNPVMRQCYTCTHQTTDQWPGEILHGCGAGVPSDERFDVEEGDANCAKWKAAPND